MPRHFTIPTMLRMTPNAMLQKFFQRLDITLPALDWRKLGERQVEPLLATLSWIPRPQQELAESSLAGIFELACDTGWQAILDAAGEAGELHLARQIPDHACCYERAMWTWLERPEIFEQATLRQQIDGLTRWRKRTGLPVLAPRITRDSIGELAAAVSQCLRREEGRGQNCTVDYFRRASGTDIFVAYPDDFVRTVTTHDGDGRLVPRPIRATFEIVFALRAEEGALDLFAQVAPALKPKLENVFGQIILGADLGLRPSSRPFDLNRLKDRYFSLNTDPADRVSAFISRLRLSLPNYAWLTVEPKGRRTPGDIYAVIDDCLNDQHVHWHEIEINLATFRFEFEAAPRRRASALSLDVTYPDHCSIKSRRPESIELARKYLRRWRIANV